MRSYLDLREINGYSVRYTDLQPTEGLQPINCLVYIGLPSNPQFTGPQDPEQLAAHILRSRGPSGPNVEYLYMLEEALGHLGPKSRDEHVIDLATRCRRLSAMGATALDKVEEVEKIFQ